MSNINILANFGKYAISDCPFISLCICFWNMGLWNFRDMIVAYETDIGDMIVTVPEVWS